MEEYEVDLRDYLRVMWQRKWLIVLVFIVALGAATLYSFQLPDEYRAVAVVSYRSEPQLGETTFTGLPSLNGLIAMIESSDVSIEAERLEDSELISLTLYGTAAPDVLAQQLRQEIARTRAFLDSIIQETIGRQSEFLDAEISFYRRQRQELLDRIEKSNATRREVLEKQKAELVGQIRELMAESSGNGNDLRQTALISLTAQLHVLEGQLLQLGDRSERLVPEEGSSLALPLIRLDEALLELKFRRNQYEIVKERDWGPLTVVGEAQGSSTPVGPSRKLNIAIAGVLGLFVGILLAFFVHYLRSEPAGAGEIASQHEEGPS